MSYVAPDGNSYKTMIVSDSVIKLYTNKRLCFCNECKYQNNYIPIGLFRDNNDDTYACGIMAESGTTNADIVTSYYPSGSPVTPYKNRSDYKIWVNNNTPSVSGGFGCTQSDNPSIQIFSTKSEAYAYLTAPEVFQIPSFSFSGSILPGQNSSLSQGSCSLASPYTTSFSFEGKCRELVSLKQLFYDKTGYTVTDDLVNQTKSYMETHQQHQIYWIGGHDLNGHYGFHVFVCAPGSYFESNAGQGGQLYYKAPTKRWYWNVDSTTHKSVTTLNTYWDFNSDGSSFQIWNTYTFGIVGGYNDYDY